MSRHIPRHARWNKLGPNEYTSERATVRYSKGAWWAEVTYRQQREGLPAEALLEWEHRSVRLGPFKRPRNAMIAAEDHTTILERRHGDRVVFERPGSRPQPE